MASRIDVLRRSSPLSSGHDRGLSERDSATVGAEPAVCDRRAEHTTHRPGADADREAPEQVHLPQIAHENEPEEADDDEKVANEHHATRSVAIDERPAERTAKP